MDRPVIGEDSQERMEFEAWKKVYMQLWDNE